MSKDPRKYYHINKLINNSVKSLKNSDKTFESIFHIMFSHENKIIAEYLEDNKIVEVTYKQAYDKIINISNAICDKLHLKNEYIGLNVDNRLEWIILFWAILKSGNKPYLINNRQPKSFTISILKTLNAKAVISYLNDEFEDINVVLYQDLENMNSPYCETIFENEIALTTSATTLKKKICIYSGFEISNQILDSKEAIKKNKEIKHPYKGRVKALMVLPLFHIFGLMATYLWLSFFGVTFVFLHDLSSQTVLKTIKKCEVTHIFSVPVLFETINKKIRFEVSERDEATKKKFQKGIKLSLRLQTIFPNFGLFLSKKIFKEIRHKSLGNSVRFMISGGAYIKKETVELLNAIGYPLFNGYGMSEVGITSVDITKRALNHMDLSIGKPFSNIEFKISDDNHLLIKGDVVCKKVIIDGDILCQNDYFDTFDIVRIDKKKRYFIEGRASDLVIGNSGENLNPNIAEEYIKIRYINNFSVLGNLDMSKLMLVIELPKNLYNTQIDVIKEDLKKSLSMLPISYQISEIYFTYDSIMNKNDIKISRDKLRHSIKNKEIQLFNELNNDIDVDNDNEIKKEIRRIFSNVLNIKECDIKDNSHFINDLDGTSLDYYSIVIELQKVFNVALNFEDENYAASINDFEKIIKKKMEE